MAALFTQVEQVLEGVQKRAKNVNDEVKTCIRANMKALEEKEQELISQVNNSQNLIIFLPHYYRFHYQRLSLLLIVFSIRIISTRILCDRFSRKLQDYKFCMW